MMSFVVLVAAATLVNAWLFWRTRRLQKAVDEHLARAQQTLDRAGAEIALAQRLYEQAAAPLLEYSWRRISPEQIAAAERLLDEAMRLADEADGGDVYRRRLAATIGAIRSIINGTPG